MKKFTFLFVVLGAAFLIIPHANARCPITHPDCHEPPGPPPPPPPPRPRPNPPHKGDFLIRFTGFSVLRTRSRHEDSDTLWTSAHLIYPNGPDVEIPGQGYLFDGSTLEIGNVNDGYHAIGAVTGPFWMDTDSPVNLQYRYLMVNYPSGGAALWFHNHGPNLWGLLGLVSAGYTGLGGPVLGYAIGQLMPFPFTNCGGPVAANARTFTGRDVYNLTNDNPPIWHFDDWHEGSDSPRGCGANSRYRTYWQLERFDPAILSGYPCDSRHPCADLVPAALTIGRDVWGHPTPKLRVRNRDRGGGLPSNPGPIRAS